MGGIVNSINSKTIIKVPFGLLPMSISLCMIAKNEAKNIGAAIDSVKSIVDEIIVVDTGSSDTTSALAKKCGAQVYSFHWNDDFS